MAKSGVKTPLLAINRFLRSQSGVYQAEFPPQARGGWKPLFHGSDGSFLHFLHWNVYISYIEFF